MSWMLLVMLGDAEAVGLEGKRVELDRVGVVVAPPWGWETEEPESDRLDAKKGALSAAVFKLDFQVAPDEAGAALLGATATERASWLADGKPATLLGAAAAGGRTEAWVRYPGEGGPSFWGQRGIPVAGATAIVRVTGPDEAAVRAAVDAWAAAVTVNRAPQPLPPAGPVASPDGAFQVALPPGYRAPVPAEGGRLEKVVGGMRGDAPEAGCVTAVSPYGDGNARALLACQSPITVGFIVDEVSMAGEEALVRQQLFGPSGAEMSPGRAIALPDRTAFAYPIANTGEASLEVGVLPTATGSVLVWLAGKKTDGAALTGDLDALLAGTSFSAPNNAAPAFGAGAWVSYALTYRLGWVLAALSPFALLAAIAARLLIPRKPRWEDVA